MMYLGDQAVGITPNAAIRTKVVTVPNNNFTNATQVASWLKSEINDASILLSATLQSSPTVDAQFVSYKYQANYAVECKRKPGINYTESFPWNSGGYDLYIIENSQYVVQYLI